MMEAARCLLCEDAPCFHGCPAGVNPKRFIRKIRFGNLGGAVRELKRANVLAASCAYICPCQNTCAAKCTSEKLDRPIDISMLQRFVCDWERQHGMIEPLAGNRTGKKVAIIGAGPAGLSCAANLSAIGHEAHIFETSGAAGGLLRSVVPAFRLPPEVLDFEIEFIKKLGVIFNFNSKIENPSQLLASGFNAVFMATGCAKPKGTTIISTEKQNVVSAMSFLKSAKEGSLKIQTGCRVIVIGGGDTAIDSAMVAARAGGRTAMLYRRGRADMPAYRPDIALAEETGVELIFNTIPRSVAGGESAQSLRCVRVKWLSAGRGSKDYAVEGSEFAVPCDLAIIAAGQEPESLFDLRTAPNGCVAVDHGFMTSAGGVFAGGDIVSGPATAVAAVGAGKLAAGFIDKFLIKKCSQNQT